MNKQNTGEKLYPDHILLRCQSALFENLDDADKLNGAINAVLQDLGETLEASYAYVFGIQHGVCIATHGWHAPGRPSYMESCQHLSLDPVSYWLEQFQKYPVIWVTDMNQIADRPDEFRHMMIFNNARNYMIAPLSRKKEVTGFIGLTNIGEGLEDKAKVILLSIGHAISTCIRYSEQFTLLKQLSYVDPLVGIGNRNAFLKRKNELVNSTDAHTVGIVYIDLNNLKLINDTLGHRAGDRYLLAAANTLIGIFGKKNVFRVGGDEFVVICTDWPEEKFRDQAEQLLHGKNRGYFSTGLMWSEACSNLDKLIEEVDTDMYRAKMLYKKTYGDIVRPPVSASASQPPAQPPET